MQNNITIPDNWEKNRIARIEWFLSFKFKYGLSVQKFANFKQPSISNTGLYSLRRLGEALYKETYVSPSQILFIPKAVARKNTRKGGRKRASSRVLTSPPVRDEIVVNKTNRQTKIKKTKKARKSLFCKVSSDSESEVESALK